MTEGDPHKDAVARGKQILRVRDHEILENSNERGQGGYAFPPMVIQHDVASELKSWTADIYAARGGQRMIVEIDGQLPGQGHNSEHAKARDHRRDQLFWDVFGIPTIRLWTSTLVGADAYDDHMIMQEINFQRKYWLEHGRPPLN